MAGVFEGLNFMIEQLDNSPVLMEQNIENLYKFLRSFHENEVLINKKVPFGKNSFKTKP